MPSSTKLLAIFLGVVFFSNANRSANAQPKPIAKANVLIITVDDMSADSLGVFGCKLADTSPNIDALAKQGMRFNRAHVVVGNCFPSRNVMWSGLYPHNTGVEGFYQIKEPKHLHLADLMQAGGYFTGIQHKVSHSTPYSPYPSWDVVLDTDSDGKKRHIKAAKSYFDGTKQGIQSAREAGKPFCLMINVADPHKPFYAEGKGGATVPDKNIPSKVFTPDEVPIPGFLFDDPVVRKELAHYYSSVRRADDCVGEILRALDESGLRDETVILFLSDHGMPLPFAKTQVYHHSSHTPLFLIVPGVTKANSVDAEHMVSAVDLLPTLLELTGVEHPKRMDGRSFASLLKGEKQADRHFVIKEYHENAGGSRDPMRSVQTEQFLYIFNPWSNGTRVFATATSGTSTYRRMAQLAKTDTSIGLRDEIYKHRTPEELYDIRKDPDCLLNLIDSSDHQPALKQLTSRLEQWMVDTNDDMLPVFRKRDDAAIREAYVVAQEKLADERRAKNRKKKRNKEKTKDSSKSTNGKPDRTKQRKDLISFGKIDTAVPGKSITIRIQHNFTDDDGPQTLTATFKGGSAGKRIERKTVKVRGKGTVEVKFDVPADVPSAVSFAVFVGEEYQKTPQHLHSAKQKVEQ